MTRVLYIIYSILVIIHLILNFTELNTFRGITKCLLMPMIIMIYFDITQKNNLAEKGRRSKNIILGLTCGLIGDFFLINEKSKINFMIGLISFLLGHILYIAYLIRKMPSGGRLPLVGFGILIFSFYFLIYFKKLHGNIPDILRIPTMFYTSILAILNTLGCYHLFINRCFPNIILVIGAFSFSISDLCLALNTFCESKWYGNFVVMSTYIIAQTGIAFAEGIKQTKRKEKSM